MNGKIEIIETRKNMETKRKYGLTTLEQEEMIKMLEPKDLYKGPIADKDIIREEVWIFKKFYNGIEIVMYIKLKIRNGKECICLSLHEEGMIN